MYLSFIHLYPAPGNEHILLEVLESMKGPMATQADCLDCQVLVGTGEAGLVLYMERWRTREALVRHQRSALYGRLLEAMELSGERPRVEFFELISIGGMELLAAARSQEGRITP